MPWAEAASAESSSESVFSATIFGTKLKKAKKNLFQLFVREKAESEAFWSYRRARARTIRDHLFSREDGSLVLFQNKEHEDEGPERPWTWVPFMK